MKGSEGARIAINPHQFEPLEKEETEKVKAFTGNKSASGRVPDPESFLIGRLKFVNHTHAGTQMLIVWLCSDQASFMTGANIPIDGGYVAQ